MDESWAKELLPTFLSIDMQMCFRKLKKAQQANINIFPKQPDIFKVFKTPLSDISVVILGQDPYYDPPGAADGLAFSSGKRGYLPASLKNILTVICNNRLSDYNEELYFLRGNFSLNYLAEQGVFLLNTALTVEQNRPESHLDIWRFFTEKVIQIIASQPQPIFFLLWGKHASSYHEIIQESTTKDKYVFMTSHPSPMSFDMGFKNCDHFEKVNQMLLIKGQPAIMWKKSEYVNAHSLSNSCYVQD